MKKLVLSVIGMVLGCAALANGATTPTLECKASLVVKSGTENEQVLGESVASSPLTRTNVYFKGEFPAGSDLRYAIGLSPKGMASVTVITGAGTMTTFRASLKKGQPLTIVMRGALPEQPDDVVTNSVLDCSIR